MDLCVEGNVGKSQTTVNDVNSFANAGISIKGLACALMFFFFTKSKKSEFVFLLMVDYASIFIF